MQFNSFVYLFFLAGATVLFWILPVRFRRFFVLAASLLFYASWGVIFLWVPFLVCCIVYLTSRLMLDDQARAKRWLWFGVACALGILILFKYREFLLANLAWLIASFSARHFSFARSAALPVGVSFYTFEAIGFLVDVRQGRVKSVGFLDLLLFFMFWPNVTSGPIVRARELVPQLQFRAAFEPRFIFGGLDRIIWGLVQKNVVANLLGIWIDKGFGSAAVATSTLDAWFLAIAFGLQIYFDFAGYSNMAIGAAKLLGVTLPENFRQPYHASTPADFWARWHMSLSRWIRDFLFFPINAKWMGAPLPLYVSLVAVMGLVGLWHGAGWNFILWGLLHGIYLVAYRVFETFRGGPGVSLSKPVALAWRLATLLGVVVAWVPFRSASLGRTASILASMFTRFTAYSGYNKVFYIYTLAVALFCVVEPLLLSRLESLEEQADAQALSLYRIIGRPVVYSCGLLLFLLFDEHNSQFIYSQF